MMKSNMLPISPEWGIAILRIVVGIVFLVHGYQKLFLMGFGGVAGFFGSLGIPLPMVAAIVVTLLEFFGGLALILGLFSRWIAIPLAIDMLVAIGTVHLANGFSVSNGGYEFVLTLMAASITLALAGSGALSIDSWLQDRQASGTRKGFVTAN
ncbi:MAG: DoxX family protein [Anaerolineae bacterium]|nr:DoxX family protein [Anaerolineae bacterium]